MGDPLVSVVMPVFNAERYLREAVRSVLEQSHTDFEIIAVNDGSTDESEKILRQFATSDARVTVISRENRGLVSSLNEGIEAAKGKLIARMDADDIAFTDRLERQVKYLEESPGISIIGGQAIAIDENGCKKGELKKPVTPAVLVAYLKFGCPLIHPTYLVRREVFDCLGGYREINAAEDIDLLVRAYHSGFKFGNLRESILYYRINTSGMSARNARAQVISTRLILTQHRKKLANSVDHCELPLARFSSIGSRADSWFDILWRRRNQFLSRPRGNQSLPAKIIAALLSTLHPELLRATYRTWRCKRLVANDSW